MRLNIKTILLVLGAVIILLAIPITVFLLQQQTKTTSKASPATTLTFSQPSAPLTVGQNFQVSVLLTPNSNLISFVKLSILYDNTKLKRLDPTLTDYTTALPVTLEAPAYDTNCSANICNITVTMSIGANSVQPLTGNQAISIATLNFQAIAPTDQSTTTGLCSGLCVDQSKTQVLSVASSDQPAENVLASASDATLTITGPSSSPSPSPTGTDNGGGGNNTGTGTPTPTTSPTIPVCTNITADKTTANTGDKVTFTAAGSSSNSTISKVTFAFGDGATQDVTSGGNIGTATVSASLAHSYSAAGTYTASAYLTDAANNVSGTNTCSVSVTINAAPGAPTSTATPAPTGTSTLPKTGPSQVIFGVGIAGVLSVIGGALLFVL